MLPHVINARLEHILLLLLHPASHVLLATILQRVRRAVSDVNRIHILMQVIHRVPPVLLNFILIQAIHPVLPVGMGQLLALVLGDGTPRRIILLDFL